MDEKEKALLKMKAALEQLRQAWSACVDAFSNIYIDCNDYILGDECEQTEYPFHMSFDEIKVVDWIDGALEKIKEATPHLMDEKLPNCKKCQHYQACLMWTHFAKHNLEDMNWCQVWAKEHSKI